MNIHDERKSAFEAFRKGERNVYIIVLKKANPKTLQKDDLFLRKIDDDRVSITAWIDKNQAELFLKDTIKHKNYKIIKITSEDFRAFLNQFSTEERQCILLDLV